MECYFWVDCECSETVGNILNKHPTKIFRKKIMTYKIFSYIFVLQFENIIKDRELEQHPINATGRTVCYSVYFVKCSIIKLTWLEGECEHKCP